MTETVVNTKTEKRYIITCTREDGKNSSYQSKPLTLTEAIEYYGYTLQTGKSYEMERGNKKINTNPKTIKGLITALFNATNNACANGYSGKIYTYTEV